jgi:hypothetical protein
VTKLRRLCRKADKPQTICWSSESAPSYSETKSVLEEDDGGEWKGAETNAEGLKVV